jgi:hypothetical protein
LTTIAFVLIALGGLALLVGSVFLIIAAFRVSTAWGLTILFLSWLVVPTFIFLFKHWLETRTWFLVAVTGGVVSAAGWFVLAGTETMASGHHEPIVYSSSSEETPRGRSTDDVSSTLDLDPDPVPTATPSPTRPPIAAKPQPKVRPEPVPPPPRAKDYRVVGYDELDQFIGERVNLHLTDGTDSIVILDRVTSSGIKVSNRVGGGMMSYRVPRALIAEIRVRN